MNNNLVKKLVVLVLSLTMVMSSFDLSFALEAEGNNSATSQETTEEVKTDNKTVERTYIDVKKDNSNSSDVKKSFERKAGSDSKENAEAKVTNKNAEKSVADEDKDNEIVAPLKAKSDPNYTISAVSELEYTGEDQTLISASNVPDEVTVYYYVSSKELSGVELLKLGDISAWKKTAQAKNAGDYYVYYQSLQTKSYKAVSVDKKRYVKVSIAKADLNDAEITIDKDRFEYDETEKTVNVKSVKTTKNVSIDPSQCTVVGNKATNIGNSYSVYVTGKDPNTKGTSKALTWSIVKPAAAFEISSTNGVSFTYTGNNLKPTLQVLDEKSSNTVDSNNYEVKYLKGTSEIESAVDVGEYKAVVTGKAGTDYEGCERTLTWNITKANATASMEGLGDIEWTGSPITLVKNQQKNVGTIQYKVMRKGALGEDPTPEIDWTETVPSLTNINKLTNGSIDVYRIYYRINGNDNYSDFPARTEFLGADTTDYPRVETKIIPRHINRDTISIEATNGVYTGKEITSTVTVKDSGRDNHELTSDECTISDNKAIAAGDHTITVTGKGNYDSTNTSKKFNIAKAAVTGVTLVNNGLVSYEKGKGKTPVIERIQTKNGDLEQTFAWKDVESQFDISGDTDKENPNTDGNWNIVVTAKNDSNFSGSADSDWNIAKVNLSEGYNCTITPGTYNGSVQDISKAIEVKSKDGQTTLAYGIDYTVKVKKASGAEGEEAETVKNAGTYYVDVTAADDANVTGKISDVEWVINQAEIDSLTLACTDTKFDTTNNKALFANKKIEIKLTVKAGVLEPENSDYDVTGTTEATATGDYSVTVTGKGNFKGSKTVNWSIVNAITLEDGDLTLTDVAWSDSGVDTTVTVKHGGKTLVKDEDFEIVSGSETHGTDVGEYSVTIKGIGFYDGTVTKKWNVTGTDISDNAYVLSLDGNILDNVCDYDYDGKPHTPTIKLTHVRIFATDEDVTDKCIAEGTTSATNAGEYTITLKGDPSKGYTGQKSLKWKINKVQIALTVLHDKDTGKTPDVTYDGEKHSVIPVFYNVSSITDQTPLSVPLEDITVATDYTDNIEATNAGDYPLKFELASTSNYEFAPLVATAQYATWTIKKKAVKLSWKENSTTYNGQEQLPELKFEGVVAKDEDYVKQDGKSYKSTPLNSDPVNAGVHSMTAEVKLTGDAATNYTFTTTVIDGIVVINPTNGQWMFTGSYTINRAPVHVVWNANDGDGPADFKYSFDESKPIPVPSVKAGDLFGDDELDLTASVTAGPETGLGYLGYVGEYTATATKGLTWDNLVGEGKNYVLATEGSTMTQDFTIEKAEFETSTVLEEQALTYEEPRFTYDTNSHTPVVVSLTATNGHTFNYSDWDDGDDFEVNAASDVDKTEACVDGASYNYQLDALATSRNFKGSANGSWWILSDDISSYTITAETVTYNQQAQKPSVTVIGTTTLTEGADKDYTVDFLTGKPKDDATQNEVEDMIDSGVTTMEDAGTYYLYVKGVNNYSGYQVITWTINKAVIGSAKVEGVDYYAPTYNGKPYTVSVTDVKTKNDLDVDSDFYDVTGDLEKTDAGIYTVTVSAKSDSKNYEGTVDVTWEIKPEELEETDLSLIYKDSLLKQNFYIYDGRTKGVEAAVVHNLDGDMMTLVEDQDYEIDLEKSTTSAKDAGTYKVVVNGKKNYTGSASAEWVITGFKTSWLVASLDQSTFTYDGTEKEPKISVGLVASIASRLGLEDFGLKEGEDYEVIEEGENVARKATDAGEYKILIKGKKYFQDTKELKWEIKPAEIQKDWILAGSGLIGPDKVQKVNGRNYSGLSDLLDIPAPEVDFLKLEVGPEHRGIQIPLVGEIGASKIYVDRDGKLSTTEDTLVMGDDKDYTIKAGSETKGTESRSYKVTIVGHGNYTGETTVRWSKGSIVKCKIDGNQTQEYETEYDGTPHDVLSLTELWTTTNKKVNLANCDIEGTTSATNAGEYSFIINGHDDDSNFYGMVEVNWTIKKRRIISVWEDLEGDDLASKRDMQVTYNGKEQRPYLKFYHVKSLKDIIEDVVNTGKFSSATEIDTTLPTDIEGRALSLVKPIDANTYQMFARLKGGDAKNYEFFDMNGLTIGSQRIWYTAFTINPKPITIQWSNDVFDYDGDYKIPTATAVGLENGEKMVLTVTGRAKNAGTHKAKVKGILLDSKIFGDNYTLPTDANQLEHTFTINKREISKAKFNTVDVIYNGKEQNPTIIAYDTTGFLNNELIYKGSDFSIKSITRKDGNTEKKNKVDAGIYIVTIQGEGNYTGETNVEWTINKARPSYTVTARTGLTYTGKDQKVVDGYVTGGKIEYYVSDKLLTKLPALDSDEWTAPAQAKDAGTYYVYFKIHGDDNHHSIGGETTGLYYRIVTISPATLTADMISLVRDSYVYDGIEKEPAVKVALNGVELPETDYHICTELPKSETKATDAGEYSIFINPDRILSGGKTSGNLVGLISKKIWEITPKPITVTVDNKEKYYGDADPEFTSTTEPGAVVGTDNLKISYERAEGENVGEYTINAISGNKNYDCTFITGILTIGQREITLTIDDKSKTYGDADETLTWQDENGEILERDIDNFELELAREEGENIGDYAIQMKDWNNKNYDVIAEDGTYTITKKPVTFTWELDGVEGAHKAVYDGDMHEAIATVHGLIESDEDILVVALDDNVGVKVGKYTAEAWLEESIVVEGDWTIPEDIEEGYEPFYDGYNQADNYVVTNNVYDFEVVAAPAKPEKPDEKDNGTKTGDQNNMRDWMTLGGIALVAIIAEIARRRKVTK